MANVDKTFGSVAVGKGGFTRSAFSTEAWLESTTRAIKGYVIRNASAVYDIRMEFPAPAEIDDFPQLPKTVIHFEVDDVVNDPLGMGDNYIDAYFDETPGSEKVTEVEGIPHRIIFDVGIWASPVSGGTTARMRAYQLLTKLFVGSIAYNRFLAEEDIEILEFQGGSFVQDTISDLPVFRATAMTLSVRVFERRADVEQPQVMEAEQDQTGLLIS